MSKLQMDIAHCLELLKFRNKFSKWLQKFVSKWDFEFGIPNFAGALVFANALLIDVPNLKLGFQFQNQTRKSRFKIPFKD